jgi:hypothetical protein
MDKQTRSDNWPRTNLTHGLSKTRLYRTWLAIKRRCYYKKGIDYKYYGGRGITVCDEWINSFETFKEWALNNGYEDTLSIDRKLVNENYSPSNCRWVSHKVQMNNFRRNRKILIDDQSMNVCEAAIKYNIRSGTIIRRLNLGWSDLESVTTKPTKGRNQYDTKL